MEMHKGKEATKALSPEKGHSVVIYTHKFKPQHFSKAVEIVEKFSKAQSKGKHKRLNIFLTHPSTHEIVNVSFFDGRPGVQEWHESDDRRATVEELEDKFLEKPIDVQVFEVVDAVGVG